MKFNEEQNLIEEIIEVIHNAVQGETLGHLSIKEGNKELKELAKGVNLLIQELHARSKERFKHKKSFYQAILEQLPYGIAVLDKNFKYIYCNPAFFNDKQSCIDALGLNDFDLLKFKRITRTQAYSRYLQLKNVMIKGESSSEEESFEKDGKKRYYRRTIIPLFLKWTENTEFYLCFLTEFTAVLQREKELENKIAQLLKSKDELDKYLHHVTHDLKAPLASIEGLINISSKVNDPNELLEYLDIMRRNVHQMAGFIKTILDHSRNNKEEVSLQLIDFKLEVERVIESLRFMEGASKINFNVDVQVKIDFFSDPARIYMILTNLISNAIKYHNYGQETPFIHILIRANEIEATVKVIDNGEGISADHHSKLFKSFEKVSEKSKGSGLGLYLVKEVVQKLEGDISFESVEGHGTSFEVKIPNATLFYKIDTN
jgi:signal transduction histidine kinase